MEKKPVIECNNVTVRYGDRTILNKVNFKIYEGEVFVIVGGSGCGKSTLLRQIIGLETPSEGEILIDSENFSSANNEKKLEILRKFGVLFQSSGLFASMTIGENIALSLEQFTDLSKDMIDEVIDMKLRTVGLGGFQNYHPNEISGGMKKRAALARAMTLDPKILCFDEPSSGLDPVTSASLDNLIKDINRTLGTTMVVVTHDLASTFSIAHRVIMLDKSVMGILAEGKPDELKERKDLPEVYKFFNRLANNEN